MMVEAAIKIGYLVSYDWLLLKNSIPLVYPDAEVIVLALDINRKTWNGNVFDFDDERFYELIKSLDVNGKIIVYEDDFYDPTLTTMQNEVRERNMLAARMGSGGWHIQLDADEYPIDFSLFVEKLKNIDPHPGLKPNKPVNVCGNLITIIKKVPNGFLCVNPDIKNHEQCMLATQFPHYEYGRKNGYFNVHTSMMIVHESIRSDEEFYFKLKNWGHNKDFNTESYFALWKSIDGYNFHFLKDFHPISKKVWPELILIPVQTIPELIEYVKRYTYMKPTAFHLWVQNSRNLARIIKGVSVLKRLFNQ
jgi:hypothetical protein